MHIAVVGKEKFSLIGGFFTKASDAGVSVASFLLRQIITKPFKRPGTCCGNKKMWVYLGAE